jgi:putative oxidoreductase
MTSLPQTIGAIAGLFILIGLWTPIAGMTIALSQLCLMFSRDFVYCDHSWNLTIQAGLGATLAMIGPGAWSVDAKLFGRKHIDI